MESKEQSSGRSGSGRNAPTLGDDMQFSFLAALSAQPCRLDTRAGQVMIQCDIVRCHPLRRETCVERAMHPGPVEMRQLRDGGDGFILALHDEA